MSKNCNCIYDETCICPDPASCAFNDFSELDTDVQTEPDPSKDRETARHRRYNTVKQKNKSLRTVSILSSKLDRLPDKSSASKDIRKAILRVTNATKQSKKYKKQNKALEEKAKPYRK